jgi:small-conductance mechanosensitive channel
MREFVQSVWNYLPSLLGAIVILVGGVVVAWIVAGLVRALLKKSSLDNRIVSWATGNQLSQPGCSEKLISRTVFWILIVFVLAGFFQALRLPVITDPLVGMLRPIFGYLPRLGAACCCGVWPGCWLPDCASLY